MIEKGFNTTLLTDLKMVRIGLKKQFTLDEQERTRLWLLSPEMTQKKLHDSLNLLTDKLSNRRDFEEDLLSDKRRFNIRLHVRSLKDAGIDQVIISDEDKMFLKTRFFREHHDLKPRHQRDLPRLFALCKAFSLLNFTHRERNQHEELIATHFDIEAGYDLYSKIGDSNELGLPPEIFQLWNEKISVVLDAGGFLSRREIATLYFNYYKTRIGDKRQKKVVNLLCETGLAVEDNHPQDGRLKVIYSPNHVGENITE
jgi:hypothetical protein